jgi:hypothetical protein
LNKRFGAGLLCKIKYAGDRRTHSVFLLCCFLCRDKRAFLRLQRPPQRLAPPRVLAGFAVRQLVFYPLNEDFSARSIGLSIASKSILRPFLHKKSLFHHIVSLLTNLRRMIARPVFLVNTGEKSKNEL